MANVQIPDLPVAIGLGGPEELEAVQGGVSVRTTAAQIAALATGSVTAPQSANTVLAGPASGPTATPTFRALVGADLPDPTTGSLGGVLAVTGVAHQWVASISVLGVPALSQPAFTDISGSLNLATQVTGNLAVSHLNSGTGASSSTFWRGDGTWVAPPNPGGTVTTISVVTANGLAGTVANPTTTPALTLSTTVTGILQGNGTIISAATTTGSGSVVLATSPTLTTPALGTPSAAVLTNATGLPISTGVSGLGTGVATFLATPSSANLLAAVTGSTGTGAAVFGTSPTIATPVINGLPTGTGVASAATASTLVSRDANANISANNVLEGYATTATAAGTTTLTVSSAEQQYFTGTNTQTVTLPVTSTLVLGQNYTLTNNSTGAVTVQSSGANFIIAMAPGSVAVLTCILTSGTTAASWNVSITNSKTVSVPVRQTVLFGPVSAGAPNFLPATTGTLSITTQNVSTGTSALVATAANGFSVAGSVDVVGQTTANITWSSLTASNTSYLGATIAGGAFTTFSTTLVPIYQFGGTISVTNGQYTFDYQAMQMFLGNGTTAPAVNAVFFGEVVTSVSAVTSSAAYAYQGVYYSGFTNTLPAAATATSKNSNLGVADQIPTLVLQNLTAEGGYSIGDRATVITGTVSAAVPYGITLTNTRNAINFTTAANTSVVIVQKANGTAFGPTLANWSWQLIAKRAW